MEIMITLQLILMIYFDAPMADGSLIWIYSLLFMNYFNKPAKRKL